MKKTGLMSALDAAKPAAAPSAGGKRGKKKRPTVPADIRSGRKERVPRGQAPFDWYGYGCVGPDEFAAGEVAEGEIKSP
jgi:hypothetical protein